MIQKKENPNLFELIRPDHTFVYMMNDAAAIRQR